MNASVYYIIYLRAMHKMRFKVSNYSKCMWFTVYYSYFCHCTIMCSKVRRSKYSVVKLIQIQIERLQRWAQERPQYGGMLLYSFATNNLQLFFAQNGRVCFVIEIHGNVPTLLSNFFFYVNETCHICFRGKLHRGETLQIFKIIHF